MSKKEHGMLVKHGESAIMVLTRARVVQIGLTADAEYLVIFLPDSEHKEELLSPDGTFHGFPLDIDTLEDLASFCKGAKPHTLEVSVAPGEDADGLRAALLWDDAPESVLAARGLYAQRAALLWDDARGAAVRRDH